MEQRPSGYLNPFASSQSDAIRDVLASRIDDVEPSAVWAARARSFADVIAPVLSWAHDVSGLELKPDRVAACLQFDNLVAVASHEAVGAEAEAPLSDWAGLPDPLRSAAGRYLAELPGFVPGVRTPAESAARVVHSYAQHVLCRSFH